MTSRRPDPVATGRDEGKNTDEGNGYFTTPAGSLNEDQWDWSPLAKRGFEVRPDPEGGYFLERPALLIKSWPEALSWMSFGKVRCGDVDDICSAVDRHRLRMSERATRSCCRRCGATIWWVTTAKRRAMPLEADGGCHVGRCGARS